MNQCARLFFLGTFGVLLLAGCAGGKEKIHRPGQGDGHDRHDRRHRQEHRGRSGRRFRPDGARCGSSPVQGHPLRSRKVVRRRRDLLQRSASRGKDVRHFREDGADAHDDAAFGEHSGGGTARAAGVRRQLRSPHLVRRVPLDPGLRGRVRGVVEPGSASRRGVRGTGEGLHRKAEALHAFCKEERSRRSRGIVAYWSPRTTRSATSAAPTTSK